MASPTNLAAASLWFFMALGRSFVEQACTAHSRSVECQAFVKDLAMMAEAKPLMLVQKGAASALQEGQPLSKAASGAPSESPKSIAISAGAVTAALIGSPTSPIPQKPLPAEPPYAATAIGSDANIGPAVAEPNESPALTAMLMDWPVANSVHVVHPASEPPPHEGRIAELSQSQRMQRWPDHVLVQKETTPEPLPSLPVVHETAKEQIPATFRPNSSLDHGFNLSVRELHSLASQESRPSSSGPWLAADTQEALLVVKDNSTDSGMAQGTHTRWQSSLDRFAKEGLASARNQQSDDTTKIHWKEVFMGVCPLLLVAALATAAFRIFRKEPVLRSATAKMFVPSSHVALLQEAYDVFEVVAASKQAEFQESGGSSKMFFRDVRVTRPSSACASPAERDQVMKESLHSRGVLNNNDGKGQSLCAARGAPVRESRH